MPGSITDPVYPVAGKLLSAHDLLEKFTVQQWMDGGISRYSDLHLKVGSVPMIRVRGVLVPGGETRLDHEDLLSMSAAVMASHGGRLVDHQGAHPGGPGVDGDGDGGAAGHGRDTSQRRAHGSRPVASCRPGGACPGLREVLADSNFAQTFANGSRAGNSRPRDGPDRLGFVDRGVTTLL